MFEPTKEELKAAEAIEQRVWDDDSDPLEELWAEARREVAAATKREPPKPSASETARRRYTDPENWQRTRALALIDKQTKTLIGNFSEYLHKTIPNCRKLLREHQPMEVAGVEEIEGYLGAEKELAIRQVSWDKSYSAVTGIVLDELSVECPEVAVTILTRFQAVVRVTLDRDAQFASPSGNVLLQLPAGTDIFYACSTDTKINLRKWVI